MKRNISKVIAFLVVLVVMLSLCVGTISISANSANLVPNPSLEDTDMTGWDLDGLGVIDSTVARTGSKSLKITGSADNTKIVLVNVPIKANKQYEISFYTKDDGGRPYISLLNNTEDIGSWRALTAGSDWTRQTFIVDSGVGAGPLFIRFLNYWFEGKTVWVDDFNVQMIEPQEINILSGGNSDFETNTTWTSPAIISSDEAYSGTKSLKFVGTKAGSVSDVYVPCKDDTEYQVSFYYKNQSGTPPYLQLTSYAGDITTWFTIPTSIGKWSSYTMRIKTQAAGASHLYIKLIDYLSGVTYFDDFSIVEVGSDRVMNGNFKNGCLGWEMPDEDNIFNIGKTFGSDGYSEGLKVSPLQHRYKQIKQTINVVPNTNYTITYKAKSDILNGALTLISNEAGVQIQNEKNGVFVNGNNTWYNSEITFNSGVLDKVTLAIQECDPGGNAYFDDFKMYKKAYGEIGEVYIKLAPEFTSTDAIDETNTSGTVTAFGSTLTNLSSKLYLNTSSATPKSANIVMAVYRGNKMVGIDLKSVTIQNEDEIVEVNCTITDIPAGLGNVAKIFLFEDIENLVLLTSKTIDLK